MCEEKGSWLLCGANLRVHRNLQRAHVLSCREVGCSRVVSTHDTLIDSNLVVFGRCAAAGGCGVLGDGGSKCGGKKSTNNLKL